jgi:hypothetical protein
MTARHAFSALRITDSEGRAAGMSGGHVVDAAGVGRVIPAPPLCDVVSVRLSPRRACQAFVSPLALAPMPVRQVALP